MIYLNNNARFGRLNYISYFFYYPHKAGNLELCRLVVSLCRGKQPFEKNDWLNSSRGWPAFFGHDFAGDSMKEDGPKAKFFRSVQVYSKDLVTVVVH